MDNREDDQFGWCQLFEVRLSIPNNSLSVIFGLQFKFDKIIK